MEFFTAEMTCLDCGTVNPPDTSTNMSTHLRDELEPAALGVGTVIGLALTPEHMERSDYLLIQEPPGSHILMLERWECSGCPGTKWAVIEIKDGVIVSIHATRMDREAFEAAHYIRSECIDVAKDLTLLPYDELVDMDLVQILREKL